MWPSAMAPVHAHALNPLDPIPLSGGGRTRSFEHRRRCNRTANCSFFNLVIPKSHHMSSKCIS
jgi:hypothetical protein